MIRRPFLQYLTLNMSRVQTKEIILKAVRDNHQLTYSEKKTQVKKHETT